MARSFLNNECDTFRPARSTLRRNSRGWWSVTTFKRCPLMISDWTSFRDHKRAAASPSIAGSFASASVVLLEMTFDKMSSFPSSKKRATPFSGEVWFKEKVRSSKRFSQWWGVDNLYIIEFHCSLRITRRSFSSSTHSNHLALKSYPRKYDKKAFDDFHDFDVAEGLMLSLCASIQSLQHEVKHVGRERQSLFRIESTAGWRSSSASQDAATPRESS